MNLRLDMPTSCKCAFAEDERDLLTLDTSGYNVTLLSDVTAGFNHSAKEAIETMVWPLFSNRVLKISQWVEEIEADDGKNHKL